jgi:hypothetical protein
MNDDVIWVNDVQTCSDYRDYCDICSCCCLKNSRKSCSFINTMRFSFDKIFNFVIRVKCIVYDQRFTILRWLPDRIGLVWVTWPTPLHIDHTVDSLINCTYSIQPVDYIHTVYWLGPYHHRRGEPTLISACTDQETVISTAKKQAFETPHFATKRSIDLAR